LFGWQCESSINNLHEVSFFTENDTFALRHCEILKRLGIRPQPGAGRRELLARFRIEV
jgi:hypothetical protein